MEKSQVTKSEDCGDIKLANCSKLGLSVNRMSDGIRDKPTQYDAGKDLCTMNFKLRCSIDRRFQLPIEKRIVDKQVT
jgi:hypothetical protein